MIYPLRKIPDELWTAAKVRALRDKLTMRQVIEQLLREYVAFGLRKVQS